MNAIRLAILLVFGSAIHAVPLVERESCTTVSDCLHGFPVTVTTLTCSRDSICVAKSPRSCEKPFDCPDPLTSCVENRCSHGARGAPCSTRGDCGIGLFCSLMGICEHGMSGVKCSPNSAVQCFDGLTCTVKGTCSPGFYNSGCVLDRNCGAGLYCDGSRCKTGAKHIVPRFFMWGSPPPKHSSQLAAVPVPAHNSAFVLPSKEPEFTIEPLEPVIPSSIPSDVDSSDFEPQSTKTPEFQGTVILQIYVSDELMSTSSSEGYTQPIELTMEVKPNPESAEIPTQESNNIERAKLVTMRTIADEPEHAEARVELVGPYPAIIAATAVPVPSDTEDPRNNEMVEIILSLSDSN